MGFIKNKEDLKEYILQIMRECPLLEIDILLRDRFIDNLIDKLDLDPYEFRLYSKYKLISSEQGVCIKSTKDLAQECNMSVRKLQLVKKTLSEPRELLGGKALISIAERTTKAGCPDTDLVKVTDILPDDVMHVIQRLSSAKQRCSQG